jgi:arylsulfatase A-like enzyme
MRFRLSTLLLLLAMGTAGTAHARPDIVTVLLDDVRADDVTTLLDAGLMPNLRQFVVNEGISFDNSFVTTSLCGPSRATFLTGQYSHNHGVECNLTPENSNAVEMLNHDSTLAVWLQQAGYRTAHVGKYLNGYGSGTPSLPGPLNPRWIPPGWDDWYGLVDFSTYSMYGFTVNENRRLVSYAESPENYQTDVLAELATKAVAAANPAVDSRPLFLVVTPLAAHYEHGEQAPRLSCTQEILELTIRPAPRHVDALPPSIQFVPGPAFDEADMTDKPPHLQALPELQDDDEECVKTNYRARLASLLAVDDLIGQVVAELKSTGRWDNTILVVSSDNGFFLGEHRLSQKVLAYEPSIRVPLYVRVPGTVAQRTSAFVVNNDLAATAVALAEATPDIALDGRSLAPLFTDPAPADWRKRFLVEYLGPAQQMDGFAVLPFHAVRTAPTDPYAPNAIAVFWDDGSQELYMLNRQPDQLDNLALDPRFGQVLAYLKQWADRLRNCTGQACRTLEGQ